MASTNNPEHGPKQPIVISIYLLIVALLVIVVIQLLNGAEITHEKDIAHWFGLVIEIGIAIGIAIVVWHYTKYEQTKTNSLILKVNEMTSKLEHIIQNQEESKIKRKETALGRIETLLTFLWSETKYHEALILKYYGEDLPQDWQDYEFAKNETTKKWILMIKEQAMRIGEDIRNWTLTSYDVLDQDLLYALQCIYLYASKPFIFDKQQPQWDLMDCQDQLDWLESVLIEHFNHSKENIGSIFPRKR